MAAKPGLVLVDCDAEGVDRAFRSDVLEGLAQRQKAVPARWFYDERGSELFEDITQLPEYYPTRAEIEILGEHSEDIALAVGQGRSVVEFGAGSATKTPLLLDAIAPACYVPIDISGDFLRASCADLAKNFPQLPIIPVEADFMKPVPIPPVAAEHPRLGFFPGSTIGNLVPPTAVDLLRAMRATLGDEAMLLIGFDLIKSPEVLQAAYDDAAGVTAAFNLNLAQRINRELDGTIPMDGLRHLARWNADLARIEMHLEATRDIAFSVSGDSFSMRRGETIHTENSHKYDDRSAVTLLLAGGWTPVGRWCDDDQRFMVILAGASEARMAP